MEWGKRGGESLFVFDSFRAKSSGAATYLRSAADDVEREPSKHGVCRVAHVDSNLRAGDVDVGHIKRRSS